MCSAQESCRIDGRVHPNARLAQRGALIVANLPTLLKTWPLLFRRQACEDTAHSGSCEIEVSSKGLLVEPLGDLSKPRAERSASGDRTSSEHVSRTLACRGLGVSRDHSEADGR